MIVHIGFPKTGTSLFQKRIYPQLKEINYIDYYTCKKLFKSLVQEDDLYYQPDQTKKSIKTILDPENTNLFSFEALVGPAYLQSGINRKTIATRLKEVGPTRSLSLSAINLMKSYPFTSNTYRKAV